MHDPTPPWDPSGFNPLHCGAVVASLETFARLRSDASSFNPLHCGAVVASRPQSASTRRPSSSFNPLHCGAVVASSAGRDAKPNGGPVSIPFIAGQWSLLESDSRRSGRPRAFQSPSLRGSGRFQTPSRRRKAPIGFQSPSLRGSGRFSQGGRGLRGRPPPFQSPSLRGSGRFTWRR